MQVTVNGEATELVGGLTLAGLLAQLRLAERRLAVELNGAIVPRSAWGDTAVADGDRLEIVQAIGGG